MKKLIVILGVFIHCSANAQIPLVDIIRTAVKKVLIKMDLKVQKLQNKTIWLQNAQKSVENAMSKLKLREISEWVEQQRKLYADYFEELKMIRSTLQFYHRLKDLLRDQIHFVSHYQQAWALFRQDHHFTGEEKQYIKTIYEGMLHQMALAMDQLYLVITSFTTEMTDAARLEQINTVARQIEQLLFDLKQFNNQNKVMALQRAAEHGDWSYLKKLYGL